MRIRVWKSGPAWKPSPLPSPTAALPVIRAVQREGDAAVRRFIRRFDGRLPERWRYGRAELAQAVGNLDPALRDALLLAARRIRRVAEVQRRGLKDRILKDACGEIVLRVRPLDRAGIYVPGGRYPLVSTALMGVIPAKVAGVPEIIVCTPAASIAVQAAAGIAGADALYAVGGGQAIAAMAVGTETIPRADKIAGPGNRHVVAAKLAVRDLGLCGIDGVAGPSELLVLADGTARADWIAAELLAQAEHDPEARVALATPSRSLAERVLIAVRRQIEGLSTKRTAAASLRNATLWLIPNLEAAAGICQETAPEHLLVWTRNAKTLSMRLSRFGTLFVGPYSSVGFGDYVNGPDHTLPTAGTARWAGGLTPLDFLRLSAVQTVARRGARRLGPAAIRLAEAEGLAGHAEALRTRCHPPVIPAGRPCGARGSPLPFPA